MGPGSPPATDPGRSGNAAGPPEDAQQGSTYTHPHVGAYAMNLQLPAMVLSFVLLFTSSALACEKHINGHQNGSDTNAEAFSK
jgi:hypothetical protein